MGEFESTITEIVVHHLGTNQAEDSDVAHSELSGIEALEINDVETV